MHKQKYIVWYQENGPLYPVDRDITEYMASTDNDASRIVILPALTFFLIVLFNITYFGDNNMHVEGILLANVCLVTLTVSACNTLKW